MQDQQDRRAAQTGGFTIVELLVVIAIIAVLVAMLIPSLLQAKEQTHRVICASQLRQLGVSVTAYAVDNKGGYPSTYYANGIGGNANPNANSDLVLSDEVTAMGSFMDYAGSDARLLACPTGFGRDGYSSFISSWKDYLKAWQVIKRGDFRSTTGYFTQKGMQFGYVKYVGADVMFAANTDGPRSNPRYSRRQSEVLGGVAQTTYRGYPTQISADRAASYNFRAATGTLSDVPAFSGASITGTYQDAASTGGLSPAFITLWGERLTAMNNGIVGWDHISHLNSAQAAPQYLCAEVWTGFRWVTGMNEVMIDGHAEWFAPQFLYANRNSQSYYSVLVQTAGKSQ